MTIGLSDGSKSTLCVIHPDNMDIATKPTRALVKDIFQTVFISTPYIEQAELAINKPFKQYTSIACHAAIILRFLRS